MATPRFNSKSPTIKRILREASELSISPSPDYHAAPASDSDLFEWHFTLRGPPSSAFASGIYHGRIVLPPTYPLRPPSFRFLTPSGRFETNREICLSISGHHEETWQPAWGIRTALVALRSFMETDAKGQLGGLDTNDTERKRYADNSVSWKCPSCGKSNEDIINECTEAAKEKEAADGEAHKKIDETVPPELKIGFKPDTTEGGSQKQELPGTTAAPIQNEAQSPLPGVQVQGAHQLPATPAPASVPNPSPVVTASPVQQQPEAYLRARPAQGVPQPTRTLDLPRASRAEITPSAQNVQAASTLQATRVRQNVSNDNDLVWVDRAIAGVALCLAFMIMKVMLGL